MCNGYNLYCTICKYVSQFETHSYIKHKQYIDDIFMTCAGTKQELLVFCRIFKLQL